MELQASSDPKMHDFSIKSYRSRCIALHACAIGHSEDKYSTENKITILQQGKYLDQLSLHAGPSLR